MDVTTGQEALLTYLESPKFLQASASASRLVAKLKTAAQRRELYETQQILRTVYFRFINHKEKIAALNDLLYHGADYLLKHQETISGQDIALLLLETSSKCLQIQLDETKGQAISNKNLLNSSLAYHLENKTLDLGICQKVADLAINLPDDELGRIKFIAEATRLLSPKILNRDLFHNVLAVKFWQQEDYASARYHYLQCANLENAQDIANFLVEYHCGQANKSELDLFITQFIFQLLCLQKPIDPPRVYTNQAGGSRQQQANTSTNTSVSVVRRSRATIKAIAEKIFSTYALKHPHLARNEIPFTSLPMLNFTYFIISILNSDPPEATTFKLLCDIYKLICWRDPNYHIYLERIGTLYFGIVDRAKQRQNQGGFFNNILMSFLDGADEGEEESNHGSNNLTSSDELD